MRASIQCEQVYVAGPEIEITVYLFTYLFISSRPAYFGEAAGATVHVGASKHLDPLRQRVDALVECQGETN